MDKQSFLKAGHTPTLLAAFRNSQRNGPAAQASGLGTWKLPVKSRSHQGTARPPFRASIASWSRDFQWAAT